MPRRVYSKRTIVVRPKKKWSSCLSATSYTQTMGNEGIKVVEYTLVQNQTEGQVPAPVILKTGNFRIYGTTQTSVSASDLTKLYNMTAYVMYCPQGYSYQGTSMQTIYQHPEWIMARGTMRYIPGQQCSFSMSSRMKRNLNTGDKVVLVLAWTKDTTLTGNLIQYLHTQYYICSN